MYIDEGYSFEAFGVELTIEIKQELYPMDPRRESDNMGTMYAEHRRYTLGDKDADPPYVDDWDRWDNEIRRLRPEIALIVPLYFHDHSLIGMSAGTPYYYQDTRGRLFAMTRSGARKRADKQDWDHGTPMWIYLTRDTLLHEYGGLRVTKNKLARAIKCLLGEVETYNSYLEGDVYGYVIEDENGEHLDSCWGFYGWEWCETEAKDVARHFALEIARDRIGDHLADLHAAGQKHLKSMAVTERLHAYC